MIPNNDTRRNSSLSYIQKLLFQAFSLQNSEIYDEALQKLQIASQAIIQNIQSLPKSSQFYMKVMPILKNQRQLVSQKDYKEFWSKNEKILCRNFEKNTYRAFIIQELHEKDFKNQANKTIDKKSEPAEKKQKKEEKQKSNN